MKPKRIDPKQSYGFHAVIMRHCDLVALNKAGVAWDPSKDKPGESECFVWNDDVIKEVRGPYKKGNRRRKSQNQRDNYNVVVTKRGGRNVKREDSS